MTAKRWLLAVTAMLLLGLAVACSRGRSDAQIVSEAISRISGDPQVTNKQISIASNNGVVTLTGAAISEAERAAAANDVAQVEGVRTVVNNLLLASAPATPQPEPVAEQEPAPVAASTPAPRKPTAYRERRRVSSPASDMPIVSSGPANTSPIYSPPAPASSATLTPAVNVAPSVPPPAPPRPVTVEAGTVLSVRMIDSIDSGRNHPGDIFHATLDAPVTIDDKVVIPEGSDITGRVTNLKSAGKFEGQPELALELSSLTMNGRKYTLVTNQYTQQGKSRGANTAKKVGSGAAIGAIIGAIAGGGKGAAIGAAAGAGVGGGVQAAGHPEQVHIGTEALLSFRLESPLTVTPVSGLERHRGNNWSAPPESSATRTPDNNIVDEPPPSDSNRPVLKRRVPNDNSNE